MRKIWVTGASGLVGGAIVRQLSAKSNVSVIGTGSKELNLLDLGAVRDFIETVRPDSAILAGARVGGVGANLMKPATFIAENLFMQSNAMQASHEFGIRRLVFLSSSCVYSTKLEMPLKEQPSYGADLDESIRPYAIAKIAGMETVRSMRKEHGHDWVSVIPSNVYGPGDNFSLSGGHVVASLIRKFAEAVTGKHNQVGIWGSGEAKREFTYIDDLASAIGIVEETHESAEEVNVSSGEEISIKKLAALLCEISGFQGNVVFDRDKPEGAPRKLQDNKRIRDLGWSARTSIRDGVTDTYKWFEQELHRGATNLRL